MVASSAPEATRKMLAALWEKNLPVVKGRVDELQRAADSASAGVLAAEARASAEGTAHKLAGSLGMFGYQRGTEVARKLEQMLEGTERLDASRLVELVQDLRHELSL